MAKRARKKKGTPTAASEPRFSTGKKGTGAFLKALPLFLLKAAVIVGLTLWVFWPAMHGDWLWDDDTMILKNGILHDPDGLRQIWFNPLSLFDYFPLTISVEWLEWQIWQGNTFGYHLVTVILHIINALLMWRLLHKLGLRLAWAGGLLFAVHPVVVESVAWMVELKNTLSLLPLLLAMSAWVDYENRGGRRDYLLALGLFLVSMLAKTGAVMFPFVLLFYAWWRRGRIGWSDIKASAPFFLVSLVLGLVTIWFLHHHAIDYRGVHIGGPLSRVALAGMSMMFYLSKCLLPIGLLPIYPKWKIDPPLWYQFLPWLVLAGVVYGLWTQRKGWGKHVLMGLGFFLVMLFPFMGFTPASYMGFTWVMDHLLYIPLIGVITLAIAGLGKIAELLSPSLRYAGAGVLAVVFGWMVWQSHTYAGVFESESTLWTYGLKYNPETWPAQNNLGTALFGKGMYDEAIREYEQAVAAKSDYYEAQCNLGMALFHANRFDEAIQHYQRSLQINPDYDEAHFNLGVSWVQKNQTDKAIHEFEETLRINPFYIGAHHNLGVVLMLVHRVPEGLDHFEKAMKLNPGDPTGHRDFANALLQADHLPEATDQFDATLKINPNDAETRNNLGSILGRQGRYNEAIQQYTWALQIKPDYAEAHKNLGYAFQGAGNIPEAVGQFDLYLKLNPSDTAVRSLLTQLQVQGSAKLPEPQKPVIPGF